MIKHLLLILVLTLCMPVMAHGEESIPSDVETLEREFNDINIYFDGTSLRVTNASGLNMYVYSITGVRVMSVKVDGDDKSFKLNLQRGCYIVKVGDVVRKISVK